MRTTNQVARLKKKKRILKKVKGYWGRRHLLHRIAIEAIHNAEKYAFVGRKRRKRDFRRLWITRIGAALETRGLNYSLFLRGLKLAGVELDRKALAEAAVNDAAAFDRLVETAKASLAKAGPPQAKKQLAGAGAAAR